MISSEPIGETRHNMQKYDKKKSLHSLSNQIQTFLNYWLNFLKINVLKTGRAFDLI